MNWFQRSGYMTLGFIRKTSLQLQILLINAIDLFNLADNNFNWGWLKGDLQLKKIWELPILESDNSDVKDTDWIKIVLSQIVVARFIINSVSLVAHIANIYTILTRDRQNLLIFWMVLSFVKDIVLEIVVVIITLILWHNGSITTSLLVEFIIKKAIRLAVSIWKWCTTLNWYMQLREVARIRELFKLIAWRSNTSVTDTVRRIRHSLDDASLGVAIVRRGKYTSLLSFDELSEELSNRVKFNRMYCDLRISKSLTTLITISENYDTNGTNDYDPIANDLSVAEKSMKMLNITAEDVMDARARIQERSYWDGQNVTTKISNSVEKMMMCFPLEENGKETKDASRDRQTAADNKEGNKEEIIDMTENLALEKEGSTRYSLIEKENKTDNSETVLQNRKKRIFTEKREEALNFFLLKNEDIISDEVKDHVISMTSRDSHITLRKKKEEAQNVTKIVQCSLSGHENNMNVKVCPFLVKDMQEKFCFVPVSYEYKRIGEFDERRHPYRVETKPASVAINANRKEHSRSSKMLLPMCHCASSMNIYLHKNKKNSQSTNTKDKNVNRDIEKKNSKCFISNVVAQENKPNGHRSTLKYLERCLRKQAQTCQKCSEKQLVPWDSMSLAQTARPSGYEKRFFLSDKLLPQQTNFKSVHTEISNELENSLSKQSKLKHFQQTQHTQSPDLRLVNDFESLKRKNYMKFKNMMEARTLEAFDFILLGNEKLDKIKAKNRYNLFPSRKLSAEERETIELRALKAYNKQTLLEDKKELEAKKKYDSSLNHERSLKKFETSKITDSKTYENDVTLLDREGIETITENDLSTNCKQSIEKLEALTVYNKLASSDYNLVARRKHDSSKHAASLIYEEDIEVPTRALNLLEADNVLDCSLEDGIMSHLTSETHDNASNDFDLSGHNARHTRISLNLWEITRNIEWTPHPGGITLTNKNLQSEFSENGRSREGQLRDIVNNNTASILHNAFFFKPEIIMRIFRRAQTRLEESLSNFWTWRRGNFSVEFICRVSNEMNVQNRDSSLDFDLEWMRGARNNLSHSLLFNINGNHIAEEANSPDLCIIFIGREEFLNESETAIIEDSAELERSAHLSIENVQYLSATNILVLDTNYCQTDNATADNLSVQFIISLLRNFGIEMPEESIRNVSVEQIEEFGNISNVIVINDFLSHTFNTNDMSNNERNMCDKSQSAHCNNMVNNESTQTLCLSNNYSDNLDVSSVKSLKQNDCYNSQNEKYLSAIDIKFENKVSENNLSLINVDNDVISQSLSFDDNNNDNNETEENTSNVIFENSMKIFSSKTSFIKSYNCQTSILKSADKKFQKLTQLANERSTSENERGRSIANSGIKSSNIVSQSQDVETLRFTTMMQNSIKSEDEGINIYRKANKFSSGMYSSDESDFDFLYEKNDDRSEPTLHEGSLMEEFSNDTLPIENIFGHF